MTDERIKEIYVDDDLEDLANLRYKSDKESEPAKLKRSAVAYTGFLISFFVVFYLIERPSSIGAYIGTLILSAVLSFLYFLIGGTIFWWLYSRNQEHAEYMAFLETRIHFAEERIKNMSREDLGELFAKRLWHYTQQFSSSAHISDPKSAAIIWAALVYSARDLLDEHYLRRLVEKYFRDTVPSQYSQGFEIPSTARAMYNARNTIYSSLLEEQNALTSNNEIEYFFITHDIPFVDSIPAFQEAQYNAKRYIRIILNTRKPAHQGPQFPGPIPG